jgi:urease accessory protein
MTVLDALELTRYRNEPAQMPSGSPGKNGLLNLTFEHRGDRSVLARIDRRAPLHAQQALYCDEHLPGLPCVYMIMTSGCVLQGDRFEIAITAGANAIAHVTTQSAMKIHQMDANYAAQSQHIALADNAYLELLPGPVIPHRQSRFITRTQATVAGSATLLAAEILLPGRKYHGEGELFEYDVYSSALTATRPDDTPLFTEKLVAEPSRRSVRHAGAMGKFDVLANVTLVTPRHHADWIFDRAATGSDTQCMAGASRLPGDAGLSYKVIGEATEPVKSKVRDFWALVRQRVLGAPIPRARLWG